MKFAEDPLVVQLMRGFETEPKVSQQTGTLRCAAAPHSPWPLLCSGAPTLTRLRGSHCRHKPHSRPAPRPRVSPFVLSSNSGVPPGGSWKRRGQSPGGRRAWRSVSGDDVTKEACVSSAAWRSDGVTAAAIHIATEFKCGLLHPCFAL